MIELRTDGGQRPVRIAAALDVRDVDGIADCVELTVLEADWRRRLDTARPDAVVVQAVELRPHGLPVSPVGGRAHAVAAWARSRGVPSIFWSTVAAPDALDDLWAATAFDHVATADLDAVLAWRSALGHDRVHLARLGVAVPDTAATHDRPLRAASLVRALDPAAAQNGLLDLVEVAVGEVPVLLHDLAPGTGAAIPDDLAALAGPPLEDVTDLDRACAVGLHLPTATRSPSLLDRRLLQLLAAGIPVAGPHSHAGARQFGDVATLTGDPARLADAIAAAAAGPDEDRRDRGRALVRDGHSWQRVLVELLAPVLDLVAEPVPADGSWVGRVRQAGLDARDEELPGTPEAALVDLGPWLGAVEHDSVTIAPDHGDVVVISAAEEPLEVWSGATVRPGPLLEPGWTTVSYVSDQPGLVALRLRFLDEDGVELRSETVHANTRSSLTVPRATSAVRVGVRVHGPGRARVGGLRLGGAPLQGPVLSSGEHVLLTNRYPSYDAPYNNMFVHKRVQGYQDRGAHTDVLRMAVDAPRRIHEFEGIECVTGGREVLDRLLDDGQHHAIAAHFLTPAVWEMLSAHADHRRVCVWIHGFEIQPWWRRAFSYESDEELAHAKQVTTQRMDMWREVLADDRLHFVFVSQFLADQAMQDTGVALPQDRYSVIHNPIDTDLFAHNRKSPEQRFDLLSIRPFASNIYANDLTVAAILDLVDEPWFDRLNIRIVGAGRLFVEVTEPLWELPNVTVEPRFLQQAEIAQLHRQHGVFLCPSRLDSHGVSRDEAMASGLVPVTSHVAAIPEFVDESCGFLTPPDDPIAIADAIRSLVDDPDLFLRMSDAAADRVRNQADHRIVLDKELTVLRG